MRHKDAAQCGAFLQKKFCLLDLERVVHGGAFLGVSSSEHEVFTAGVEIRSLIHLFTDLLYTRFDVVPVPPRQLPAQQHKNVAM